MLRSFQSLDNSLRQVLWGGVVLLLSAGDVPVLEAVEAPLLAMEREGSQFREETLAWQLGAADDALKMGFSALAADLYAEVLDALQPEAEQRPQIVLQLASALISEARYDEATGILEQYPQKGDPAYRLRRALLAYQNDDWETIAAEFNAIPVEELIRADHPWYYLLAGLVEEARQNLKGAERYFEQALELSVSAAQRVHFESILFRTRLFFGQGDETVTTDLRAKAEAHPGQLAGFQMAKVYAVMLDEFGRKDAAIHVIEEQLQYASVKEGDLEDELLLLLGLIAGEKSDRGRLAFQNLLRKEANRDLQRIALHLLARQALGGDQEQDLQTLLNDLIERPTAHPLLDELYYFRACWSLYHNRLDSAETDAKRLLDQFPGSPLANSTIRLLAYLSWQRQPPQYRAAAGYLNRLRANLPDGPDKAQLAVLLADCYYLNEDYENAADAYGTALLETERESERASLTFQRVMAEIGAGRLQLAVEHLDAAAQRNDMDPLHRWRAEWNLINKMKAAGQIDIAFARVRTLLREIKSISVPSAPPELSLRLMWLEALLSIETDRAEETPALADRILNTLAEVPKQTIDATQRDHIISHTLLLKGQAYFRRKEVEAGLKIFEELSEHYPTAKPTIMSYLIEARYYASINRTVDAQQRLIALADRFPESKYAPIALWEAALNAEQRGMTTTDQEAVTILERLVKEYPKHELVYYARLKQADLSRKLNDFGTAQLIYEELINQSPDHQERHRAEISRADCFLAQASQNTTKLDDAIALFERLVDLPNIPVDLRVEAGFKWGFAVAKKQDEAHAQKVYWLVINRFLKDLEIASQLGAQGRYWLSRLIFELGTLLERGVRYEEAREVYTLVTAYGLPGQALATAKIKTFSTKHN